MIAAASSDGRSCSSRAISSADRSASSAAPPSGPSSRERFHRELAVALDEEREGGVTILVAELGEDLREVGRVLLLQQIDEVRRRADAQQALDRVEDDVNLALRHEQIR